jgi:hypothetical protein
MARWKPKTNPPTGLWISRDASSPSCRQPPFCVAQTIVFRRLRWQATENDGPTHLDLALAAVRCGTAAAAATPYPVRDISSQSSWARQAPRPPPSRDGADINRRESNREPRAAKRIRQQAGTRRPWLVSIPPVHRWRSASARIESRIAWTLRLRAYMGML